MGACIAPVWESRDCRRCFGAGFTFVSTGFGYDTSEKCLQCSQGKVTVCASCGLGFFEHPEEVQRDIRFYKSAKL